jgi:hypothetical protein
MSSFNGSAAIAIKLEAEHRFNAASMLLLYIIQKARNRRKKVVHFSKTSYIISNPYTKWR